MVSRPSSLTKYTPDDWVAIHLRLAPSTAIYCIFSSFRSKSAAFVPSFLGIFIRVHLKSDCMKLSGLFNTIGPLFVPIHNCPFLSSAAQIKSFPSICLLSWSEKVENFRVWSSLIFSKVLFVLKAKTKDVLGIITHLEEECLHNIICSVYCLFCISG